MARRLVDELIADVGATGTEVDAVAAISAVFAVRAQTTWLSWPMELEPELLQWMLDNHGASRSRALARTAEVSERFEALIRSVVQPRRAAGKTAPDDVTASLMRERVALSDPEVPGSSDRALRDAEIVSILRNWASANRDERAFSDPEAFDPVGNAGKNLVYGAGKHVCPGRPLATMELVAMMQEVLAAADVRLAETVGEREVAPVGGWAHAPVALVPRS